MENFPLKGKATAKKSQDEGNARLKKKLRKPGTTKSATMEILSGRGGGGRTSLARGLTQEER